MSEENRMTLERVEKEMTLKNGQLTGAYPWKPCVKKMRNNRDQVLKVQERIETRAMKDGTHEQLIEEMEKAIKEGSVRKLSKEEMTLYEGPVNYNPYFGVKNENSVSTKLRVVLHSAHVNVRSGLSLNDCMDKGPNQISSLVDCLIHWRTVEKAVMADLRKAYQAINTGEKELHLRRIVYRKTKEAEWEDYGYTRATFGDLAAGLLLEAAKRRAAEEGEKLDPLVAKQLRENVYVDNICGGGSPEEVEKMVGEDSEGGGTGTLGRILETCGMKLKFVAVSGDKREEVAELLGGRVLGLGYKLAEDQISLSIPIQHHGKGRPRQKEIVKLGLKELEEIRKGKRKFTRREALSLVMGVFDPLGLLSPVLLQGKLLLRRLYGQGDTGWDTDLPLEEKESWAAWLEEVAQGGELSMERTVRPSGAEGSPIVVGFSDASVSAMCGMIFVVWPMSSGPAVARLLLAKVRVTPVSGYSVPRAELQAVVIMARLLLIVLSAAAFTASRVVLCTDSACCVSALRKVGISMNAFFANRVSEVRHLLGEAREKAEQVEDVQFVEGRLNPADQGTRPGCQLQDLALGSQWQEGPEFLKRPRETWPLKSSVPGVIPKEELRTKYLQGVVMKVTGEANSSSPLETATEQVQGEDEGGEATTGQNPEDSSTKTVGQKTGNQEVKQPNFQEWTATTSPPSSVDPRSRNILEMARDSLLWATSWGRGQGALARRLRAQLQGSRQAVMQDPTPVERDIARRLQISACSESACSALEAGKLKSIGALQRNGVVYMSGRVRKEHMAEIVGREELAVIMPRERLARLVMEDAHREDHRRSPQDVMARARRHIWIPQGGRLARQVVQECVKCRRQDHRMSKQIMASLPSERLQAAAPFEFAALDLFGPVFVKEGAQGRRRFKCWITLFICLASRAVAMFSCPGYDTQTFLLTYTKFTSTYGAPRRCYSDHGSQIRAGVAGPDWEEISRRGSEAGTEWVFTAKGCSWRNGSAERGIRMARHTLMQMLLAGELLDTHRLEALLSRAAYLINSRPLNVRRTGGEEYYSITANDFLLGRAARSPGDLERLELGEEETKVETVISQQEELARTWWTSWVSKCFPDLVPRTKWKTVYRNLRQGDICHIKYASKHAAPAYRLCRVSRVCPDQEGRVRTVQVSMRPRQQGDSGKAVYINKELQVLEVGVQRLAVILPVEEQQRSHKEQGDDVEGRSKSSQKKKQLEATEELAQGGQQEQCLPREETGRLEAAGPALQAERRTHLFHHLLSKAAHLGGHLDGHVLYTLVSEIKQIL